MQEVSPETQNLRVERYTLGQTTSQVTDVDNPKKRAFADFCYRDHLVLDFSNVQATFSLRSKTIPPNASG